MWLENKYRRNSYVERFSERAEIKQLSHFYHLGASVSLRNEMTEALVIASDFVAQSAESSSSVAIGVMSHGKQSEFTF